MPSGQAGEHRREIVVPVDGHEVDGEVVELRTSDPRRSRSPSSSVWCAFDAFDMALLLCRPAARVARGREERTNLVATRGMGRSPHLPKPRLRGDAHLYAPRVEKPDEVAPVRLAELVASLSLGIDLGFGQPMEHVLRQCLIALRLGEQLGLDETERARSTTPRCSSTWAATPTPTSRPSGSATTSRSRRPSTSYEPFSVRDIDRHGAPDRVGRHTAAPVPHRTRVRRLRPSRGERHDRPPRRARP